MVASSVLLAPLVSLIRDLGFLPQGPQVFAYTVEDCVSGWLGLNVARRGLGPDTLIAHPVVGVRHASVEALVARMHDTPLNPLTPTISRPLRDLGDSRPPASWLVSPNLPDGGDVRAIVDWIGGTGIDFISAHSSLETILDGARLRYGHGLEFRIPAIEYLLGNTEAALRSMETTVASLGESSNGYADEVRKFAERFRAFVDTQRLESASRWSEREDCGGSSRTQYR